MRISIVSLALAAVLGGAGVAQAQDPTPAPSPAPVGTTASATPASTAGPTVWGILGGWYGGMGVGGRFMIPLGAKPLLTNTNVRDSFALEVGVDFMTWSYNWAAGSDYRWSQVLPVVGVMWNLWLNEKLAVYPKLDLGYAFGWFSGWDSTWVGARPTYGGFFWNVAAGGIYRVNNSIALRGELGYAGLKLGAAWLF